MTGDSHEAVMEEDGFLIVRKGRRSFFGGPKRRLSTAELSDFSDPQTSTEAVRRSLEHAHESLEEYLEDWNTKFFESLNRAVGADRQVRSLRAVGIGNFNETGSDSALQLAVFQRIQRHFGYPPAFFQEPRCSAAERAVLESVGIAVLPPDSLHALPKAIQLLTRSEPTDVHLVFMIHFDQFGFERVLESFARLGLECSLVFVGNCVPSDHPLFPRLAAFESAPVELPERRSASRQLRERCASWWRKAFANTRVYFHK